LLTNHSSADMERMRLDWQRAPMDVDNDKMANLFTAAEGGIVSAAPASPSQKVLQVAKSSTASGNDEPADDCADLLSVDALRGDDKEGDSEGDRRKRHVRLALTAAMKRKDREAMKRLMALQRRMRREEQDALAQQQQTDKAKLNTEQAKAKISEELMRREEVIREEVQEGVWMGAESKVGFAGMFSTSSTSKAAEGKQGGSGKTIELRLSKDGAVVMYSHEYEWGEDASPDKKQTRVGLFEVASSGKGDFSLRYEDDVGVYSAKMEGCAPSRTIQIKGMLWPYFYADGAGKMLLLSEKATVTSL